jgi:multiple sugar transport system permease protein
MVSDRGRRILEQGRREQREADGRLYLPSGNANRVQYEKLLQEAVFDNPSIPPNFKQAYTVVRDLMPHTHIRPVTPIGQLLWTQHVRATDLGDHHTFREEARKTGRDEAEIALTRMQAVAQEQLDQILHPRQGEEVHWKPYFITYALLLALPLLAIWVTYKRRRREYGYRGSEVRAAMLFASPWMIGFAVFVGGPIIFSIVLSFTKYDVLNAAHYVGTENYRDVVRDPIFYKSLWNTAYMLINVPLGMAISLAIALLLNRAVRGLGLYRAAFYLPAIIPLVAASLMWFWLFNPNYGLLNSMLAWLYETRAAHWIETTLSRLTGSDFKFIMPLWLKDPYLSKPSIIVMKLWGAGAGMIIWLAGLQSISQELYEAASIDGANKWKQFWNVTIPMLSPYILFNLIIGVIGTMQIFTEAYIMTEGQPADSTLFYAYYLFKQAFQFFRMGFASAMAWILFILVLALTLLQLWLSKKWVHYEQA